MKKVPCRHLEMGLFRKYCPGFTTAEGEAAAIEFSGLVTVRCQVEPLGTNRDVLMVPEFSVIAVHEISVMAPKPRWVLAASTLGY